MKIPLTLKVHRISDNYNFSLKYIYLYSGVDQNNL